MPGKVRIELSSFRITSASLRLFADRMRLINFSSPGLCLIYRFSTVYQENIVFFADFPYFELDFP